MRRNLLMAGSRIKSHRNIVSVMEVRGQLGGGGRSEHISRHAVNFSDWCTLSVIVRDCP
jgi:hypothetical protein